MKIPFTAALALTALALGAYTAYADDAGSGALLVASPHGGYNVNQGSGRRGSIAFFGNHGFASIVIAHAHDKPKYIIRPTSESDGHGSTIIVYKKIYFATAEEAEAAKGKP